MAKDVSLSKKPIAIELEKYYAVGYDDKWYIGRVVLYDQNEQLCETKFLQEGYRGFQWPNQDDIQTVSTKFVLCGPINIIGNLPFSISAQERSKINKMYKSWKNK